MRFIVIPLTFALLLAGCATPDVSEGGLDSDGDGYSDALELERGTDPLDPEDVPDLMVHEPLAFADTLTIVAGTENPVAGGCGSQGSIDVARTTWKIEAPHNATDVHVVDFVVTATWGTGMVELDIFVFNPAGEQVTEATTASIPPGNSDTVRVDGKHAAGDWVIEIRGCEGAGDVAIDATATLGYIPDLATLDDHADDGHTH